MANPLYFIETSSPRIRGAWFLETDRDSNSKEVALREIRAGGVVKVLEVCEDEGTVRDVTEDLKRELAAVSPLLDRLESLAAERQAFAFDHNRDYRKVEA